MKLIAACLLSLLVVAWAGAQDVSIHSSGGDATSWALVRMKGSQVAQIGDIQGVHVGDVRQDELIVVRAGKGYVVTDSKVLADIEAAREPQIAARTARLKVKATAREARFAVRTIERGRRALDRQRQQIERAKERGGDGTQADRDMKDLDRKQAGLDKQASDAQAKADVANKNADAAMKQYEAVRDQVVKKIEGIIDSAFARGLAKPL